MLEPNTVYNLITTEHSQAFAAYIYTTNQRIWEDQYTKGVNMGYSGTYKKKWGHHLIARGGLFSNKYIQINFMKNYLNYIITLFPQG